MPGSVNRVPRLQTLLAGFVRTIRVGQPLDDSSAAVPKAILPGAFNPLHEGHVQIARIAGDRLKCVPHYELSVTNVDKPPLEENEIQSRLAQFSKHDLVWLTRAPTFAEKARLFPGVTFIVGADTIRRITNPCYYENSESALRSAIREIVDRGCRFLVYGRVVEESFRVLSELHIEEQLMSICTEVTEAEFRNDISSTELRRNG